MWEEVVQAMWAASFEFRKGCDLYRTLIRCLTDLIFHRDAMACPLCHASIIKVINVWSVKIAQDRIEQFISGAD